MTPTYTRTAQARDRARAHRDRMMAYDLAIIAVMFGIGLGSLALAFGLLDWLVK